MNRLLGVVFIALVAGAVIAGGCKRNEAPGVPATPVGPTVGIVDSECTFASSAEDPGDSVAIRFDWGDGDTSDWSSRVGSGETVSAGHAWASAGIYSVRAQARDKEDAVSNWSAGHQVEVAAFEPLLLLDPPSVKVIPGATAVVVVSATDEHNQSLPFSVECDSARIAGVTSTDSTITIAGRDYGTASVKVSCGADLVRTFPVQVYDPEVLETDELMIAFVDSFEYRWCDRGSGQPDDGQYYHPIAADSFKALGSVGWNRYFDPNGLDWAMVVKANRGRMPWPSRTATGSSGMTAVQARTTMARSGSRSRRPDMLRWE